VLDDLQSHRVQANVGSLEVARVLALVRLAAHAFAKGAELLRNAIDPHRLIFTMI
jgi:hypothetical protein